MAGLGYQRSELQRLAEEKLEDAWLLASHSRWSNAYYLGGYAVELALKACIARQFRENTLPDPDLARNVYVHDFGKLVRLADLNVDLKRRQANDPQFGANWSTISEWNESTRYESIDSFTCQVLLKAVAESESGVLQWLKQHW